MNNTASLFPADRLTLQTEDGRTVVLEVVSIKPTIPPEPETELVSVVFRAITPREALAEHDKTGACYKQYVYAVPKSWDLQLGDQIKPTQNTATVVGFPESYDNPHRPLKTLTKRFG